MIARYDHLHRHPAVFLSLTGLRPTEFAAFLPQADPVLASLRFPKGA